MKLSYCLIVLVAFMFSAPLFAEGTTEISLQPDKSIYDKACPTKIWSGVKVVWQGIKDKRESKEVGYDKKKNIEIIANPSLDKTVDDAIKTLLQRCGVEFIKFNEDKDDEEKVVFLSGDITEFRAGATKKFLTSTSNATSRLSFMSRFAGVTSSTSLTNEIENKSLAGGSVKKINKTLNQLMGDMLMGISKAPEFNDLIKPNNKK